MVPNCKTKWLCIILIGPFWVSATVPTDLSKQITGIRSRRVLQRSDTSPPLISNKVTKFHVKSDIRSRFATTNITAVIANTRDEAREVIFTAVLPNAAFITYLTMFVDEKLYVGEVKEKGDARRQYDVAKAHGENAGLVAHSVRETNLFEISANVHANSSVKFDLTYQELLDRANGAYKHVINVNPGQVVDDMSIDVSIVENSEITNLKTPKMEPKQGEKTNSDLMLLADASNIVVERFNSSDLYIVDIHHNPSAEEQKAALGNQASGQFVVLYDVARDNSAGEIQAVDGYFVQFFAPTGVETGTKTVVFVLDKSGSMAGQKIKQLKAAMRAILNDLNSQDLFSIVTFSSNVNNWKPEMIPASAANVAEAINFVETIQADGGTAIHDAYRMAIDTLKSSSTLPNYLPIMFFLTDGQPSQGVTNLAQIVEDVISWNKAEESSNNIAIHNIAFGDDADFDFLTKISKRNRGVARKIFMDSDADLQLRGFYEEISTPLLSQLQIHYVNDTIDVDSIVLTREHDYYDGSELVALGLLRDGTSLTTVSGLTSPGSVMSGSVTGKSTSGQKLYPVYHPVPCWQLCEVCPAPVPSWDDSSLSFRYGFGYPRSCVCTPRCDQPPTTTPAPLPSHSVGGFIERMWAYTTIKRLLDDAKYKESDTAKQDSLQKRALQLSLKYHFVTELTSIVVTQDSSNNADPVATYDTSSSSSNSAPQGALLPGLLHMGSQIGSAASTNSGTGTGNSKWSGQNIGSIQVPSNQGQAQGVLVPGSQLQLVAIGSNSGSGTGGGTPSSKWSGQNVGSILVPRTQGASSSNGVGQGQSGNAFSGSLTGTDNLSAASSGGTTQMGQSHSLINSVGAGGTQFSQGTGQSGQGYNGIGKYATTTRDPPKSTPNPAVTTTATTTTTKPKPATQPAVLVVAIPSATEISNCTFATTAAASVTYDKSHIIPTSAQNLPARQRNRSGCAALCNANAASAGCNFAVWLPNGGECLMVAENGVAECGDKAQDNAVSMDEATVLYCIQC